MRRTSFLRSVFFLLVATSVLFVVQRITFTTSIFENSGSRNLLDTEQKNSNSSLNNVNLPPPADSISSSTPPPIEPQVLQTPPQLPPQPSPQPPPPPPPPPPPKKYTYWVEDPDNWQKCVDYTKDYTNKFPYSAPPVYPSGDLSSVKPCAVYLVGSGSNYQNDFKRSLQHFDKNFNDFHHMPVYAFHFNLVDSDIQSVSASTRSNMTWIKITAPTANDPASPLNPTPIYESNQYVYSFPREYRFQSYFFADIMYNHPSTENCTYIFRIDNDMDIVTPVYPDIFQFFESNGFVFGSHHWALDPQEICQHIYPPTEYFREKMPGWVNDQITRPLSPKCQVMGGAFSVTYAPFFRSPAFKTLWRYYACLGGIWTHRWAEQNLLPLIMSLIADDPERRSYPISQFVTNHRGGLLDPHLGWGGFPTWPYLNNPFVLPKWGTKTLPTRSKKGCVIYYCNKADIDSIRRSLANLEYHYLRFYKAPIIIFHQELNEGDQQYIRSAIDSKFSIVFEKGESLKVSGVESFYVLDVFKSPVLNNYHYFLKLDPQTNLISTPHWDFFKYMEFNNLYLAYHRHKHFGTNAPPDHKDEAWWQVAEEYQKAKGTQRPLTPKDFTYPSYFMLGSLEFFRSADYLEFASKLPHSANPNAIWPLAISLLEDNPWARVTEVSALMINWNTNISVPLFHRSWWDKALIPYWPYVYSNRNPPCYPAN